jgi:hypothetical protein
MASHDTLGMKEVHWWVPTNNGFSFISTAAELQSQSTHPPLGGLTDQSPCMVFVETQPHSLAAVSDPDYLPGQVSIFCDPTPSWFPLHAAYSHPTGQ